MRVKARVGFIYQLAVKPLFTDARLVSGYQKNGLAVGVEREGYAPDTISGVKP